MAHDIALCHHERWDGAGYPNGRSGDEIPLAARIVSVADVYDALVSKRVYKNAMEHEVARGIIFEEKGKQFDPTAIESFERIEDEFVRIHEQFEEDAPPLAA